MGEPGDILPRTLPAGTVIISAVRRRKSHGSSQKYGEDFASIDRESETKCVVTLKALSRKG
jgi:hypothetical protein